MNRSLILLSILQDRKTICEILCNGLARQEYRGYDSAGIGIDGDKPGEMLFFKEVGKVAGLRKKIAEASIDTSKTFVSQVSIAHTRWATHGPPSIVNCHPLRSDPKAEFTVVHNGIVTNSAALRLVLQKRGYRFESETDTEAVAILTKYIYDSQADKRITFPDLVKTVLKELEGSFAFVFKSSHYPNEVVTARRGSPLLIGVKTEKKLKVDFVDVEFTNPEGDSKGLDARKSYYPPYCIFLNYVPCQLHPHHLAVFSLPPHRAPTSSVPNPGHSCPRTVSPSLSNSSLPLMPLLLSNTPSAYCTSKTMISPTLLRVNFTSTDFAVTRVNPQLLLTV